MEVVGTVKEGFVKSIVDWCKKKDVVNLSDYLNPSLITFLDVSSRDVAISTLVDLLVDDGCIEGRDYFYKAVLEREKIVSTGIGMGVAVPHAKLRNIKNFFIAIGVQRENGLDWNSLDGTEVRLIFLIGGPEGMQMEYLQILSKITEVIKDEYLRKKILGVRVKEDIIKLLKQKEAKDGS